MNSPVIPGRREATNPESITTAVSMWYDLASIACFVVMDSGLACCARGPE